MARPQRLRQRKLEQAAQNLSWLCLGCRQQPLPHSTEHAQRRASPLPGSPKPGGCHPFPEATAAYSPPLFRKCFPLTTAWQHQGSLKLYINLSCTSNPSLSEIWSKRKKLKENTYSFYFQLNAERALALEFESSLELLEASETEGRRPGGGCGLEQEHTRCAVPSWENS